MLPDLLQGFELPFMPWQWWAVLIGVVILYFVFGGDVFVAIYRFLVDIGNKLVERKKVPVFNMYGVYLYCGRVGTGKTISMVRRAARIKKRYPKVKIYSNFHTEIADGYINTWRDVYDTKNIDDKGVNQGVLFLFDEIHLTFGSRSWKDAPANLLEYISLQRHLHKCIFGSTQVYTRVDKVIREQADWIVECNTYFGKRLIRNKVFTQEEYMVNGDLRGSGIRRRHYVSNKCYYASDRLRSLYDTDEIVGALGDEALGVTRAEKKAMDYDSKE